MKEKKIREIMAKVLKDDTKTTIIMTPTINGALHEWKALQSRWPTIIKRTNKADLCIELSNGHKIYFKAETKEQNALLGCHVNIIFLDDFIMPEKKVK